MTSSLQLERYYKNEPLFGGVFSKDRLPLEPGGKFYIINLEDADDGDGTHWTCVVDFLPNTCLYVDPYGISPPPDIVEFMRRSRHGERALYSRDQYQELTSTNCGLFCVEFIDELLAHRDLHRMDEDLTEQPSSWNEKEVRKVRL
jgi:hypothetical protein